jgi:hypothetical protein
LKERHSFRPDVANFFTVFLAVFFPLPKGSNGSGSAPAISFAEQATAGQKATPKQYFKSKANIPLLGLFEHS